MKKILSILLMTIACVGLFAKAKIVTYPVPLSEKAFTSYKVSVNGIPVDCYKAQSPQYLGGEYYFCYFDFEGEVEVKVHNTKGFFQRVSYTATPQQHAEAAKNIVGEVMPRSLNAKVSKHDAVFKTNKPFKAIVIREERNMPLIIFGNPLEKNAPKKGDKDVIYYDAGVHYKWVVELKDNQTLYLAGGAVLKGAVVARGKNIKILGRGIISLDNIERSTNHGGLRLFNCDGVVVDGVILKDPVGWTFSMHESKNVLINNFKLCASRMINDDAIDICNTSDVKIIDTFCRAQDDIIAIKGLYKSGISFAGRTPDPSKNDRMNNGACDNIYIENCIFWTDAANIFRIGYECYAPSYKNLTCKNLFVPFYSRGRDPVASKEWAHAIIFMQPNMELTMENFHFDGIEIRSSGLNYSTIVLGSHRTSYGEARILGKLQPYGRIKNCSFKNIEVYGKKGSWKGEIYMLGRDKDHMVENITLENVKYFGEKITKDSPCVNIVPDFTKNIVIK